MSAVRASLRTTHSPVVRAIQTLVRRGYVEQIANPADARSKTLSLTKDGIAVLGRDPIHNIAKRFELLPPDDLRTFKNSIRAMMRNQNPPQSG